MPIQKILHILACPLLAIIAYGPSAAAKEPPAEGMNYAVRFEGAPGAMIKRRLREASACVAMSKREAVSLPLIERRAAEDERILAEALNAEGYLSAKVLSAINSDADPCEVLFSIEAGPLYTISEARILPADDATLPDIAFPSPTTLGVKEGSEAKVAAMRLANKRLVEAMQMAGYPLAEADPPLLDVDSAASTVALSFRLRSGEKAVFGETRFLGEFEVDEAYLQSLAEWDTGAPYDLRKVRETQDSFMASHLFTSVLITPENAIAPDGSIAMNVTIRERKPRTIGAGISFDTDKSLGVNASWEHRNLRHRGERLTLRAEASQDLTATEASYDMPRVAGSATDLALRLRLSGEDTDAYDSDVLETRALLEYRVSRDSKVGGGVAYRASTVDDSSWDKAYQLISLPLSFKWDTSDDDLDPSRGGRLDIKIEPMAGIQNTRDLFTRSFASYSRYIQIMDHPALTLALRAAGGGYWGAGAGEVPPDLRFYAGGGGSVRGYEYQSIGPEEKNKPVGGRSLMETSIELRARLTRTFGLAWFVDGGAAFAAPDFSGEIRWGAGMGLRYFSPLGPLRLDVAVPLNPRDDDDQFQVYLNLGQAF